MEAGATEPRDAHADEGEASDEDIKREMAALDEYMGDEGEDESRQAKIEAEYKKQKEKKKGHWCRKYATVVLLASKVSMYSPKSRCYTY